MWWDTPRREPSDESEYSVKPTIIVRPATDKMSSRGRPSFLLHLLEQFNLTDRINVVETPTAPAEFLPIPIKLQSHLCRYREAQSAYDLVPDPMLREVIATGGHIQLWMLLEPFVPRRHIPFLNAGVQQHGLPPGVVTLMNNNMRSEAWSKANVEEAAGIRQIGFPGCYWILKAHNQTNIESDATFAARLERARQTLAVGRPKKLISFNGRLRPQRVNVLLWLLKRGHFGNSLLSLQGYAVNSGPEHLAGVRRAVGRYRSDVLDRFDDLMGMLPLNLDVTRSDAQDRRFYDVWPWMSQNPDLYDQAYLSLSIDTYPDEPNTLFLSPIAFKSFMNLSPFIYFGNQGGLAEMRRLGFQTFSPFIDEGYDDIEDFAERMNAALRALDNALSGDLRAMYEALWPRLEHNYRHIYRSGPDFAEEIWGDLKRAFEP